MNPVVYSPLWNAGLSRIASPRFRVVGTPSSSSSVSARSRPGERRRPILGPDDHLRDQRVVERRDPVALEDVRVDAHARAERRAEARDRAGRRPEVVLRILRVDAELDRVAAQLGAARRREALARRDRELRAREVDPGQELGDRVLDLEARVHLDEVEAPLGVEQELDRPGAAVVERLARAARRLLHVGAQLVRQRRGRTLLDELLVAALHRALALAEREHAALAVAEHLDLDVARADDRPLDVERAVGEARLGLGGRHAEGGLELVRGADEPHSLAAPARGRLEQEREADLRAERPRLVERGGAAPSRGRAGRPRPRPPPSPAPCRPSSRSSRAWARRRSGRSPRRPGRTRRSRRGSPSRDARRRSRSCSRPRRARRC